MRTAVVSLIVTIIMGVHLSAFADEPTQEPTPPTTAELHSKPKSSTPANASPPPSSDKTKDGVVGRLPEQTTDQKLSAAHKFLRAFDKTEERPEKILLVNGDGIAVTLPSGWIHTKSDNPNIVLLFVDAKEPGNRIEIRKAGEEIPKSRNSSYMSSFVAMLERSGFEPIPLADPKNGGEPTTSSAKYVIGGLKGSYQKYIVAKNSFLTALKNSSAIGLLLFLYKDKNEAWAFVAYSTVGKINAVRPVFEDLVKSAQFDF